MRGGRPARPGAPLGRGAGLTRRGLVARGCGAGVAAVAAAWTRPPPALAAAGGVEAAVERLLAGRAPAGSGHLRIDLPTYSEQGTTVPLAVSVDSPMTLADHVRRVSVLASGNPFPEVVSLHLTPANGRASVSIRIRLNEGTQEVVAVAELSDGRVLLARRTLEVATSGCSAEAGVAVDLAPMPPPAPRLNVPAEARRDELVEIRTMISHRMETGLRTDTNGNPIPRRIINRMVCARDGEPIFAADLTPAVAANAYLTFPVLARGSGVLAFAWREDGGGEYRASRPLTVI